MNNIITAAVASACILFPLFSRDLKIKGNSTNASVITMEEVFLIDLQD